MYAPEPKLPFASKLLALAGVAILAVAACAPQAAAPTAAPAKPAPTTAPAKPAPTTAPAKPAPTTAPAKAEAPTAKPAATTAPAAKPTEKPAAKTAAFDEKAVADFYKGKTIRIVVGFAPGGATDLSARLFQKLLPKYLPGNPTVVVENKPGGGSMLVANTVYNSEPKDGTVIAGFSQELVLQQAIGAPGVQFDAAKYQWLGSTYGSPGACAARTDSGIARVQDIMEGGKELTIGSFGKGTISYNPPAVINAALGTRMKIVTGYEGGPATYLAVKNKEVQGWCSSFDDIKLITADMVEGSNPLARIIIVTGDETPKDPLLEGVPAAETLAKTDEAKALLRAISVPLQVQLVHAVAPEVPKDRVEALRRARDRAYADPELLAGAQQARVPIRPKTGEELNRLFQGILSTPPATLAKLKQILE